ncbi:hypothetical protein SAMN05216480_10465 [Pustulibacterium marinum]|uniref:Gliding motility-associated protein GldM C-terminal domain-containing protein n=1 Tax=Pustulibacterium marinum TaxID=1224947 RepID=A0A1I7GBN6_9FLAO|nr:hypothetical protein [Pustulibacterium marinum]SFU45771.1 hypothetical protein SAMN05216480_10465 [Pustulibacterium marinum]
MRYILICIVAMLVCSGMHAQDVLISIPTQKELICDIKNPLEVLAKHISRDSLYLYTNNGEITDFTIKPLREGASWISVNKITAKDTIELDKVYFRAVSIEKYLEPSLCNLGSNATLPKEHFKVCRIMAMVVGLDICVQLPIQQFRVIVIRENDVVFTMKVATVTEKETLKAKYDLLQSGDVVYFVDMVATANNEKEYHLNGMKVYVD